MSENVRCYYLDLAKVITAFLVIFAHLYSRDSGVRLYIYGFHMPLFFLISGIFHKYERRVNWRRYCQSILWPIVIFIVLEIISSIVFSDGTLSEQVKLYLIKMPTGNYKGILWFLFALFWCKLFADILLISEHRILLSSAWLFLLIIPVLFNRRLPFNMSQGLMALPFYMIGYVKRDGLIKLSPSFRWFPLILACLCGTILITLVHGRVSMADVDFGQLGLLLGVSSRFSIAACLSHASDIALFYLNGLVGSAMVLSFALLFTKKIDFVTSLSKSLITVVGTQYLFINPFVKFMGADNPIWVGAMISLIILLLCYCMHLLLRPIYRLSF